MTDKLELTDSVAGYAEFLQDLKARIRQAQIRAALAVNRELVLLYWNIGREILHRQQQLGWGAKIVERLSKDLRREFPDMKGFSRTNLLYMRAFAAAYPDEQFVQEALGQITWYHNITLWDKVKDLSEREFYIRETIANGWSRNVLALQIQSGLYQRQGKALTNFELTLPKPQSDLAQNLLKDPYNFDFLGLGKEAHERDIERAMMEHLRAFLLELGAGFAFVGNQYHLEVGGEDFFIDQLFYHVKLRCFVVLELKATGFRPEYLGKLNFYLSAVDAILRHETDAPTVGLLLCLKHNRLVAEYALRDMNKPIGVSAYELTRALPEELKGSLPTIEEIEAELSGKIECQ
jgi:predicted nuclease of restriction endonuclease-like (RecB) superfamily